MKRTSIFIISTLVLLFGSPAYAQHLTISNTGETGTSGTNWSISGNVLQIGLGNANVNPSVIVNHLTNTGNLTISVQDQDWTYRNITISSPITYTGLNNRTLTIKSQNHIIITANSHITSTNAALNVILRSSMESNTNDEGYVDLNGVNISTNGGHLWIGGGGGDTQWNGLTVGNSPARLWLDDISALKVIGCTLATSGGNIYLAGMSFDTWDSDGSTNYGLDIDNSSISSGTGNIELKGLLYGRYTSGFGVFLGARTGNINITATTGSIIINGEGYDSASNGNGTRHATNIAVNSGRTLNIGTTTGNITISGTANFANSTINDAEGLLMSSGNTAKSLNITSQSGNITLTGTNTRSTTGQFCNGIRLYALDVSNAIYIGDNGVNAYTGNISVNADAILQRVNNTGAGSIALKTNGAITFQPQTTSFTYLRAGNASTLTFDDDWNFGTTATAITFGKPGNTFALTLSNAITTNGSITLHSGSQAINGVLTSNGQILSKSSGSITVSSNLISNAGNIILWADSDNSGSGGILVNDNVTIDSRTAADRTANTHTTGGGSIILAGGLDDGGTASGTALISSGLIAADNLPDGYAVNSGATATQCGIVVGTSTASSGHNANVNFFSGGGNIRLQGLATANSNINGPTGLLFFQGHTFNAGSNGEITMIGNSNLTSGAWAIGLDFAAWRTTAYSATSTMITGSGNINIIARAANGSSGSLALAVDGEGNNRHIFKTNTGNITFNGLATSSLAFLDIRLTNIDILSNSGTINIIAPGTTGFSVGDYNIGDGLFLGQKAGSLVTSSTANINISANKINFTNKPLSAASAGQIVIEPNGTSFSAAPIWTNANLIIGGGPSSIRVGKDGNTTAITIPSALSANGPISIYGGALTLNNSLTTTNASTGDILLKGSTLAGTGSINLANGKAVTINMSANSTCASPINGTGVNLIKDGVGELTLSAASNFNGNTTINTGLVQFNENKTFTGITISAGATLALGPNKQFDFNGALVNNGTLNLKSGATILHGGSNTISGTGSYVVEQAITGTNSGGTPNGRFWYLGSPVTSVSSSVFFGNASNVLKKRNETNNTWVAITNAAPENLEVGKGYYTQVTANSTISFAGSALNNGAISISGLTRTAGQNFEGFNLVANPYPSYLDWDAVTKTNVGNTMWYRTASGSTAASMVFETYVAGAAGGIGTNLSGNVATKWIPPMQSFWVRVAQGQTTGSIALDNTMRAHFTSVSGSTSGLRSTNDELKLFLRMNLLQADKKDQLIVYVNGNATNGFDELDGEKMMQVGMPQFYTSAAGKKITINGLNSAKKQQALPITMELPTTGVHSFVIEDLEIDNGLVWLEDKQEEIMQALEPGTVYEFYANSGINAERFVLHFQLIDNTTPINVYNEVNGSANFSGKGASVHAESAGVVVIKLPATTEGITNIQIRDAAGKLVYTGSTNALETSVQLEQANGIYYVTLNGTSGVEVRKVFIQQ